MSTGTVEATVEFAPGVTITQEFDLGYVVNDNELLKRQYDGLHMQFTYRANNWLNLGGNYTLSKAEGNFDGENTGSGPITSAAKVYPEYLDMDWYAPEGDLAIDQRHKARLWALFTLFNTSHHTLNLTWQESYNTARTQIAFITNRDGNDEVYVMNADGSNVRRLTQTLQMPVKVFQLGLRMECRSVLTRTGVAIGIYT